MTEAQINILIGFLLGLIPPLCKGIYTYLRSLKRKNDFKNLIIKIYILPIKENLKDAKSGSIDVKSITDKIESMGKKLSYLKNEELKFLNSEEQFFYIRVLEFTKSKLCLICNKLKDYNYVSFQKDNTIRQVNEFEEENINKSLEIIDEYINNVNDYAKLKTD
ncbi:hypothetical protein ACWOB1_06620 [Facklamia languida]|uniref:Uncharacterized protein n=1 Tax=Facklamia languida CCUG 37842 TaxID=883113 RepID=H3NIV3_9LACT|nr:hypothetical protein [Facklamia languida]EHR37231.1 hypothetical protein HMPREF9708_00792 [Facklamia languida CCUG 37842]